MTAEILRNVSSKFLSSFLATIDAHLNDYDTLLLRLSWHVRKISYVGIAKNKILIFQKSLSEKFPIQCKQESAYSFNINLHCIKT